MFHIPKLCNCKEVHRLLLLIEIDSEETSGIIPGKLFEYMVSERPILLWVRKMSDIEKIIKETNTGSFFCTLKKGKLKPFLGKNMSSLKRAN